MEYKIIDADLELGVHEFLVESTCGIILNFNGKDQVREVFEGDTMEKSSMLLAQESIVASLVLVDHAG